MTGVLTGGAGTLPAQAPVPTPADSSRRPDRSRADTGRAHQLPALTVETARARAVAPPVATLEVDSLRMKRTQADNPWDLVRRTAGIEVHEQGQGPGFASDAVIRGFTSDHSSDVLIVVDGVPINLPLHGHIEGYADWNVLFPGAVTGLRVIHGPASPLYGDFAFGGVVEVTTPAERPGPPSGAIRTSSFGDLEAWSLTGHASGPIGWTAGGRFERRDGWRPHSSYALANGLARWRARVGRGLLEGGLLLYGSDWHSPGFLSVSDFNANRLRAPGDPSDGGHAERAVLHSRFTTLLGSHLGLSLLGWTQALRSTVFLNIPEGDEALRQTGEFDRRTGVGGEGQLNWHTTFGDLSLGAGGRYDDVRYRLTETKSRQFVGTESSYAGTFAGGYGFVRWRELIGPIQLDLGARLDALRYRSEDRLAGAPARGHTALEFSPKLGARYLPSGRIAVLGSVSRGFRGAPGVIADPTLDPQTAWAKEVALEIFPGDGKLRLSLFRFDVSRERIQDPVTRAIEDAGRSVRQGAELEAELPLGDRLRLIAAATVNDARIRSSSAEIPVRRAREPPEESPLLLHVVPLEPGDRIPGVSRYLARIGAEATLTRRVMVGGLLRLNGPFTPIGEPSVRTRVYPLVDLSGSVRPGRSRWILEGELQNLFNTRYPEIRSSGYLNPGDPRVFRLTLRF
jgi:outer membrane receptor protein involved in Fe transport